jgi:hypothetical protein
MLRMITTVALVALSSPAFAQAILHDQDSEGNNSVRSPQRWGIELRLGPYTPDVDSEFKGAATPHRDYFGTKKRLRFQFGGEFQFFHAFGTLAAGASAGYFKESGHAFIQDSMTPSEDKTTFTLWPLTASLNYRFDVLQRRLRVPFVPYGKIGLTYTFWSITNGNSMTASSLNPEGKGRGGTPGWLAAAGLAFNLGVLDPSAARGFDEESGVNNTYLFFELEHFDASGLGRKNALVVGDDSWVGGLMFEF